MRLTSDIRQQHPGVLLLRFTTAGLMLFHGVAKLTGGLGGIEGLLAKVGVPAWFSYGAIIGEVIAPLLVLTGILVRPAALVMVVNMIFAVGLAHSDELFAIGRTGAYALELQAFFLLCSLAIAWLADGRPTRVRLA
jgi:putative oxidoreductase